MPRATPPPTLVLLVRHGVTPTTGKVLPGRAPGLHLSDAGAAQAQALAERLAAWASPAAGEPADAAEGARPTKRPAARLGRRAPARSRPPTQGRTGHQGRIAAIYSSPLERTRETAAPIAKTLGLAVKVERGLLECDYGAWTGRELKALSKLPEWSTVQRYPSGFRFPNGESLVSMQERMVETVRTLCSRHPGAVVIAVSHADPIKAAVAHALGMHLDLFQRIIIAPCSLTAITYGTWGPAVHNVNATGSLADLLPAPAATGPPTGRSKASAL
jgi:probable phosphomutase (TIGR03848 family)